MPKIAICISGQPRRAIETFPYIFENLIKLNNADVFIHMHYDPNNFYFEKTHLDSGECVFRENLESELIRLYQPKRFLIEIPRNFQKPNILLPEKRLLRCKELNKHKDWSDEDHKKHTIKQLTSMYYSIYKANELKELYANETGIVYDYVVRIRFDFLPLSPIICESLDPNFIHYAEIGQSDELISDWMNIGSNQIMNVYASLFLNIEYLNTFQYYKKEDRQPNLLEPSETCGGLYEHMLRDLMHLYKIPKKPLRINCKLLH
jgi:hypothetical protein